MLLEFTRSARRHRIGKAHVLHVIRNVEPVITTSARGETEYGWLGEDDRGVELEIAGVVVEGGTLLLITQVMPRQYRRNR